MKKALIYFSVLIISINVTNSVMAQTLYTPGGTVSASSNGFVGIGVAAPDSNLTVMGDLHLQRSSGSSFYVQTPSTDVRVFSWGNFPLLFGANGNVSQLVLTTNGNVGLGNAAPSARLDINQATTAVGVRVTTVGDANIRLNDATSDVAEFRNVGTSSTRLVTLAARPLILGTLLAQPVIVTTSNLEAMRVDASGNVGIGTTSPTQKLSVNGTILAKEVIVQTNWSDYVFDNDYSLAALSELEKEIKQAHHLPGIPSAKEVASKGINLGEMQAKLLAKVEESTLYIIQLERENQALRKRLDRLEALLEK